MSSQHTSGADRDRFTAAALRVLARAGRLAASRNHLAIEPAHLLLALVEDESHATQLLVDHGFEIVDVEPLLETLPSTGDAARSVLDPIDPPESGDVRLVVLEAIRFAKLGGPTTSVGSEHLLFGLAVVDSPVAEVLLAHDLDEATATRLSSAKEAPVGEPLPVDFEIEYPRTPTARPHEPGDPESGVDITHLDVHRIVDAAANRAREGLRVAEDHVRFVLDDAHLVRLLKELRHDLTATLDRFDALALLRARDTTRDVGTTVTTAAEQHRANAGDVLRAALKRAEEALRTLEEYGKVLDPATGPRFESQRYRLYTIEKAVLTTAAGRDALADRQLYLLLTRDLCKHEPEFVVRQALLGGVSIIQIREKSLPDRQLFEWAKVVRRLTREANALLIMNDRPDLAVLCDADGVHVGQDELTVRQSRRIVGPDRLVGVSTHNIAQARAAVLEGADYIGIGPTFPSTTKGFDDFAGLDFVRAVAAEIALPAYAIGGIDATNVREVIAAGGNRIAVTAGVCSQGDPAGAAEGLAAVLAVSG